MGGWVVKARLQRTELVPDGLVVSLLIGRADVERTPEVLRVDWSSEWTVEAPGSELSAWDEIDDRVELAAGAKHGLDLFRAVDAALAGYSGSGGFSQMIDRLHEAVGRYRTEAGL